MCFWTTGKQYFNVSNTMNTDTAHRLILSCDTTFICIKALFFRQKSVSLRHLKYLYGIYALKLNGKRLCRHMRNVIDNCHFHRVYCKYFKALSIFSQNNPWMETWLMYLESRCPAEFSSNPNQTHLNKLINVFRITRATGRWGFFQGWS